MSIERASKLLHGRLSYWPSMHTIGVGHYDKAEAIFVYVRSTPQSLPNDIKNGWMGYPVVIKKTGSVRPLHVLRPNRESGSVFGFG